MQGGSTGTGAGGQEDYLDKGAWRSPAFPSLHNPSLLSPSHRRLLLQPEPISSEQTHTRNAPTKRSSQTGLNAAEKRFGGGKVNPEQARGMNEKVTDGARGMFEKATGFVLLFPFLPFHFLRYSLSFSHPWGMVRLI